MKKERMNKKREEWERLKAAKKNRKEENEEVKSGQKV